VYSGNRVEPLIDGELYGKALLQDLHAAKTQIFLAGWSITPWFPLVRESGKQADKNPYYSQLIGALSLRPMNRCIVLVLEWRNPFSVLSLDSANSRRELRAVGIAVRGTLEPVLHQKTVIIDSTIAYCGGMDVSVVGGDRWDTRDHTEGDIRRNKGLTDVGHWHDVQVRVQGPAVAAIERNFIEGWESAVALKGEELQPGAVATPLSTGRGSVQVQVLRTITETKAWDVQPTAAAYDPDEPVAARKRSRLLSRSAARKEEYSTLEACGRAIVNAREFIYIENQYFTCGYLIGLLEDRLRAINGLSLVLLMPNSSELHEPEEALASSKNRAALSRFIASERVNAASAVAALRECAADRVFVAAPINAAGKTIYVHAKLMIIDDIYATVGSANFSDRSMFLKDLELGVAWMDPEGKAVQKFRRDLWTEHLGLTVAQLETSEKDVESMASLWKARLADSNWKPKRIMEWSAPNAPKQKGPSDAIYPW
jgi:phospholipase D1/2